MTHEQICKQLTEIYKKKNHDYGNSFSETFQKLGIISAVTRISDKTNRLVNLCQVRDAKVDESIEDTLMDLANYCILTLMEMKHDNVIILTGKMFKNQEMNYSFSDGSTIRTSDFDRKRIESVLVRYGFPITLDCFKEILNGLEIKVDDGD